MSSSASVPAASPRSAFLASLTSRPFLLLLGVLLIVASAKLWVIRLYGSDVPQIDEWAAAFHLMVRGDVHGNMAGNALWWAHGEHHPTIARWLALHTTRWNEQWDGRVQMLASVLLYLGFVGGVWAFARRVVAEKFQPWAAVVLAVILAAPRNNENFLWGFQSQFIGALTFGIWHLYGTLVSEKPGVRWLLAQAAGMCGLFTIAAGTVAPVALALFGAWAAITAPRRAWGWATLAANVGLACWGYWLLRHSHYNFNNPWPPLSELIARVGRLTAWPHWPAWFALAAVLPLAALLVLWFRQREFTAVARWILVLLAWAGGLQLSVAFGRDTNVPLFAIRYCDLLLPMTVALVLACFVVSERRVQPPLRWPLRLAAVAWAALLAWAWLPLHWPPYVAWVLTETPRDLRRQELAVRLYQQDGNLEHFKADPRSAVRFPHLNETREILDDPKLARYLPPTYQRPIAIESTPETTGFRAHVEVLDADIAWSSPAFSAVPERAAKFRSAPFDAAHRPYLRFRVRGVLDGERNWLALETADGRRIAPLNPRIDTGERWQIVNFRAPPEPVRLVAEAAAGVPLSFTAPVTVGRLSWLAPKIASLWPLPFTAGILALLVAFLRRPQTDRAAGSNASNAASAGARESERQIV